MAKVEKRCPKGHIYNCSSGMVRDVDEPTMSIMENETPDNAFRDVCPQCFIEQLKKQGLSDWHQVQ